jgi:hypothetical protein
MVKYHSTRQRHIENIVHSAVFIETDRPYQSITCPVPTSLRRWLRAPSPHHDCDLKDAAHAVTESGGGAGDDDAADGAEGRGG